MALTKVPASFDKLDDKQLDELWDQVSGEALERREAAKTVGAEVERRQIKRELDAKLSPAERDLLGLPPAIVAGPEGIESQEVVGNG